MPEYKPEDLSIIIPTRDRRQVLARTVSALAGQSVQGFETVVVVDGTDQDVPRLDDVNVIVIEHAGPGGARNAGVRASNGKLLLFLGDDMIPEPLLVARHLDRHNEVPRREVAVLGHVDWHPEVGRNRINTWMDWSSTQFDFRNIVSGDAGWGRFYSCNVSLKRELFLDAGGFDEDFTYYYEDLDLAWRLHQKGLQLLYEPRARVLHLHSYDLEKMARRFEGIARGERLMVAKHDWFTPFFAGRISAALKRPRASRLWPYVVDLIPESVRPLRGIAERRANDRYHQSLAARFLVVWEGERDLEDLKEYLGDSFDEKLLYAHETAVEREHERTADETTFYRTSQMYLYDLTAFAMSGTKRPYLNALRRLVPRGARLLDWGCGIGSDGLRMIEGGYHLAFADFANPSTEYLRWRLRRRGLAADVYDVEGDDIPGGFDVAYAFDVIEHVDEPFAMLAELERRAALVMVNLLEPDPNDTHLHRPLDIPALLDHAEQAGIVFYRRYHGRSHLVAYRTQTPSFTARSRSSALRRLGAHLPAG